MTKFRYEWFLLDYKDGVPDVMSKTFETGAAAEKVRGGIGVGIRQIPVTRAKRR